MLQKGEIERPPSLSECRRTNILWRRTCSGCDLTPEVPSPDPAVLLLRYVRSRLRTLSKMRSQNEVMHLCTYLGRRHKRAFLLAPGEPFRAIPARSILYALLRTRVTATKRCDTRCAYLGGRCQRAFVLTLDDPSPREPGVLNLRSRRSSLWCVRGQPEHYKRSFSVARASTYFSGATGLDLDLDLAVGRIRVLAL